MLMPFLMRKMRKKLLGKNKFTLYLSYALGEILLLVAGILIAFYIEDITREKKLNQEELESYELIISDLRRDSAIFGRYEQYYTTYLDSYFALNKIKQDKGSFAKAMPDHVVMNVEFNPVTQNNHQATIEKLRNNIVREQINNYFGNLEKVKQATEEFNTLVEEETRPFFLKEQNILDNSAVFNYENRTFPPLLKVSTVDTVKFRQISSHPYFIPILSQLRMSIGFYLSSLKRARQNNNDLIISLESNLK